MPKDPSKTMGKIPNLCKCKTPSCKASCKTPCCGGLSECKDRCSECCAWWMGCCAWCCSDFTYAEAPARFQFPQKMSDTYMIGEGMIDPNEGKALSCYSSTRDKCCLYFRCCACFACCSFFCCKDTHPIQEKMTDDAGSKRGSDAGAIKHFPTRKYYEVKAYDSYPEWTRDDAAIWGF